MVTIQAIDRSCVIHRASIYRLLGRRAAMTADLAAP
jgi:hypothetical protein